MPRSTRFPAAVHILAILASKPDGYVSSTILAKSLNTHAVVVRRLLALLQEAGFIETQPGVRGGARLLVDPDSTTLRDIYDAVEDADVFRLHTPQPLCPFAQVVQKTMSPLMLQAEEQMKSTLARTRLSEISKPAARAWRRTGN
ncbi:Putative HTH-type transcriptional regulator YwnA [Maioricimonas rarisocia]|uniref:HTH-type transcriptional regulator YwnA n=1 Tax=Maioricimonas rarisocia TaxID=2528026 RepID=A0A517Z4F2_9PLAN|nr:Rrf2 family transcriptional regulator [Maioricimonas rarisocia]QDU37356.1 Putative HTH-type transcriptional regulator YwnA [Maioricimonas rarisocia]